MANIKKKKRHESDRSKVSTEINNKGIRSKSSVVGRSIPDNLLV